MDEDTVKTDLATAYSQCSVRGLKQSAKWAAELLFSLVNQNIHGTTMSDSTGKLLNDSSSQSFVSSLDPDYFMAKSCFDLSEFDRAAWFTRNSFNSEAKFLHFYSRYMSAEKRRLDVQAETSNSNSGLTTTMTVDASINLFSEVRNDIQTAYSSNYLDGDSYLLYIYAIVLVKMDLNSQAIEVLVRSIKANSLNWASWHQLALLIDDKSQLESLELPSHWIKKLFLGVVYLELQMNEEALLLYYGLLDTFKDSNYIFSQIAIAKHNMREVDDAIELFKAVRESDPYRLDAMDIYSNLLYVKDMRAELSSLAHYVNKIDPFRVETCCCIANFYSLRGQHAKAVVYFSRALQLNPRHLSAWTLMGHEYMEIKNTGAAIQAYRSAIKCNKRDYRAWYGLGQTYEILKMPSYCLYYYTVARSLRPHDSRMMIATGETLEKLDRNHEALKCYWKAGGIALTKLAALYVKLNEKEKAAAAYNDFIQKATAGEVEDIGQSVPTSTELATAYKYLANFYVKQNNFKAAGIAAQKCLMYPETREEGKQVLKQILSSNETKIPLTREDVMTE